MEVPRKVSIHGDGGAGLAVQRSNRSEDHGVAWVSMSANTAYIDIPSPTHTRAAMHVIAPRHSVSYRLHPQYRIFTFSFSFFSLSRRSIPFSYSTFRSSLKIALLSFLSLNNSSFASKVSRCMVFHPSTAFRVSVDRVEGSTASQEDFSPPRISGSGFDDRFRGGRYLPKFTERSVMNPVSRAFRELMGFSRSEKLS